MLTGRSNAHHQRLLVLGEFQSARSADGRISLNLPTAAGRSAKMDINNLSENIVMSLALLFKMVTSWEAGRLASVSSQVLPVNPYREGTFDHDEWLRGFAHGSESKDQTPASDISAVGEAPLPEIELQVLPERSFWAYASLYQSTHSLTDSQLAARMGVDLNVMKAAMRNFQICDDDGIPMGLPLAV